MSLEKRRGNRLNYVACFGLLALTLCRSQSFLSFIFGGEDEFDNIFKSERPENTNC